MVRCLLLSAVASVSLMLAGCGGGASGDKRIAVSGSVMFEGKPLATGEILFLSATSPDQTPEGGPIKDGKYSIRALPGAKKVVITSTKESAEPAPDGLPNYIQVIPGKYSDPLATELTANVEAGKPLDFQLAP